MCSFGHWCPNCKRKQLIFYSKGRIYNFRSIHKSVFRCNSCNCYAYKKSRKEFIIINLNLLKNWGKNVS